MNKSKFLKKSLAALLAILMVAAMIPLSAAAAGPVIVGDGITMTATNGTLVQNEDGTLTDTLSYNQVDETLTIRMESGTTVAFYEDGVAKSTDVTYTTGTIAVAAGATVTKEFVLKDPNGVNEDITYVVDIVRPAASTSTEVKSAKVNLNSVDYTGVVDNAAKTITFAELPWGLLDGVNAPADGTDITVEMDNAPADLAPIDLANYSNGKGTISVTAQNGKTVVYNVIFTEAECLTKLTIGGVEATLNEENGHYEVALTKLDTTDGELVEVETAAKVEPTVAVAHSTLANVSTVDSKYYIKAAADGYTLTITDADSNAKVYTVDVELIKNTDTGVKSFTVNDGTYTEEGVVAEDGSLSVAVASTADMAGAFDVVLTMNGVVTSVSLNGAAAKTEGSGITTAEGVSVVTFDDVALNESNTLTVTAEDTSKIKTYAFKVTKDAASTAAPSLISGKVTLDDGTEIPAEIDATKKTVTFSMSATEAVINDFKTELNTDLSAVVDASSVSISTFTVGGDTPVLKAESTTEYELLVNNTGDLAAAKKVIMTFSQDPDSVTIDGVAADLATLKSTGVDVTVSTTTGNTIVVKKGDIENTYTLKAVQDMALKSFTITSSSSSITPESFDLAALNASVDKTGDYMLPSGTALNTLNSVTIAATGAAGTTVAITKPASADSGADISADGEITITVTETAANTNVVTYTINVVDYVDVAPSARMSVKAAAPTSTTVSDPFTWVSSAHSTVKMVPTAAAAGASGDFFDADPATPNFNLVVDNGTANKATFGLHFNTKEANTAAALTTGDVKFHTVKDGEVVDTYTTTVDGASTPKTLTIDQNLPYASEDLYAEFTIPEGAAIWYAGASGKATQIELGFDEDGAPVVANKITSDALADVEKIIVTSEKWNTTSTNFTDKPDYNITPDAINGVYVYDLKAEKATASNEAELISLGTADNAVAAEVGDGTVVITVPETYVGATPEKTFDLVAGMSEFATLAATTGSVTGNSDTLAGVKVVDTNGTLSLVQGANTITGLTVTAQDGATATPYIVSIKTRPVDDNAAVTVAIEGAEVVAGEAENTFVATLPAGSEAPAAEDVKVTAESAVTKVSEVTAGEEENTFVFTVTTEKGTEVTYTVTIVIDDEPVIPAELKLESLTIGGVAVDLEAAELAVELPYGTELTEALAVEAIAAAGEAVKVESAVVVNEDGTATVTVTVTDVNDETKTATYTVAVTVATEEPVLDSDASISGITVKDVAAEAGEENAYAVTLPAGTEYTAEDIVVATTSEKATAEVKAGETEGVYTITVTAEDGTVAEYTLTVTVEAAPVENPFQDIDPEDPDQWYAKSVLNAAAKGYIFGYDDGNFHAADNVTRAQFAAFVARLDGFDKDAAYELNFSDMEYVYGDLKAAVGYCVSKGYMNGYGGTTKFGPNDTITRQEMAIVLAKVLKLDTKNVTVTEKFEDDDKIADWAYNAVYACKNAGYLSGDGKNFDPTGSTDRGMAAVVLMQMDSAK